MKHGFLVFCAVSLLIGSFNVFSASMNEDAFKACLNRTKQARLNCQSGCGLILQQCYDEGVADLNEEVEHLKQSLKKNGAVCVTFADDYVTEASHMESSIKQRAANLLGWAKSELALNFARQRLFNLNVIKRTCVQ